MKKINVLIVIGVSATTLFVVANYTCWLSGNFDYYNNNCITLEKSSALDAGVASQSASNEVEWLKTYRNEEYGFEFKYPNSVQWPIMDADGYAQNEPEIREETDPTRLGYATFQVQLSPIAFAVTVSRIPDTFSSSYGYDLEDYVSWIGLSGKIPSKTSSFSGGWQETWEKDYATINGVKSVVVKHTTETTGGGLLKTTRIILKRTILS